MGRGLYPYAVDLALLADLPKPKTPAFAALARRAKKRLAEIDENFEDEIASGELAPAETVLATIAGGKLATNDEVHGYVVEALCATLGAALPNPIWERFSTQFFSDLDDELTARGLKGKDEIVEIVQSGVPVGKKRLRAPECGAMPPEQLARVGAKIAAMDLSALDADQRAGAKEWLGWMTKAAKKKGCSLVVFGY